MKDKTLSEELRRCFEGNGCVGTDCSFYEPKTIFTCRGLLQKAYERIKEYEEMFPCNIGDIVYRVQKATNMVYECRVTGIKQEFNTFSVKLHANITEENYSIWIDNWFDKCKVGYEIFLTKEEAETALKEL